ncbi:ABC1 kinase family protein [Nitrincola alkalilacustris]|uniref:ABC1 kinase family protein n=1 Tax=Nitrincola alkalilacustris TaxID=1571224 RepID=UPI001F0CF147|nr:AarF/ABC1/UbiB kinase family protein [Nitrincola alkalilacustris]
MSDQKSKSIPISRTSRLVHLGGLASRVAGGMMAEGVRQLASGKRPVGRDMLLTPANVNRVAEKLSHLRGAAMKVGQLLSMDAGDLLPPELSILLARLRSSATPMPMLQLADVLENNLGAQWQSQFQQFGFTPVAAASIGQVHRAVDHQGRVLALKIQYPGISQSIDSDVDNVVTLLRISRLLPDGMDITSLVKEAKQQLHAEADYHLEAEHLAEYGRLLAGEKGVRVPQFVPELSTGQVLAMSFEEGVSLDEAVDLSAEARHTIARQMLALLFRELFEFGRVQTDPNFANYFYDHSTAELVLLDFGATRIYTARLSAAYRTLFTAGIEGDRDGMLSAAREIGYFSQDVTQEQMQTVMELFDLALEPLRADSYDFASTDLATRLRDKGMQLSMKQGYWHSPPVDALFLHRKLAGLYLLFARLRVTLDCRSVLRPWVS